MVKFLLYLGIFHSVNRNKNLSSYDVIYQKKFIFMSLQLWRISLRYERKNE
jgi:hypothetical protein